MYKGTKRFAGFSVADMETLSPRARFRGLKRRRRACEWCSKKRLCSTRIGVCERCFLLGWDGARYEEPRSPAFIAACRAVLESVL